MSCVTVRVFVVGGVDAPRALLIHEGELSYWRLMLVMRDGAGVCRGGVDAPSPLLSKRES